MQRKIDQIAPSELQSGMQQTATTILSGSSTEIVTETGRQFGFQAIHEETRDS
ncbi:MAG: hypothetical protein AB7T37_01215 [Dehalococcoidia bacterium]